jgi:hypothetical protein
MFIQSTYDLKNTVRQRGWTVTVNISGRKGPDEQMLTKLRRTSDKTRMDDDGNNDAEWSTSMSSTVMACKREKIIFFLLLSVFFFFNFFLLLPKLLQGLLTTWLQIQKHTRMHNPYVNLKTHVKGKQVYVGLHHVVQILYYNQTLCVCVCTCSQDLKLAAKQALELLAPSSLRSSRTQNFTTCSLFLVSFFPRLHCY